MGPGVRRDLGDTRSAVEPPIFHAPAIVLAVDHDRDALQLRLPAGCGAEVVGDWPRAVLLQFLIDVPAQALALVLVGLCRLRHEALFVFRVAIAGVVAFGYAAVSSKYLLVWC